MMFMESGNSSAIELPPGLTHDNRMIMHHICDRLGLGSFTSGSKGNLTKLTNFRSQ
jgi:hypothetical protein